MTSSAKESRWYDVGIVKVTNMVVTHYYVPYDDNMADVRTHETPELLSCQVSLTVTMETWLIVQS